MSEQDKQEAKEFGARAANQAKQAGKNTARAAKRVVPIAADAAVNEVRHTAQAAKKAAPHVAEAVGDAAEIVNDGVEDAAEAAMRTTRKLSPRLVSKLTGDTGIGFLALSVSIYAGTIAFNQFRGVYSRSRYPMSSPSTNAVPPRPVSPNNAA